MVTMKTAFISTIAAAGLLTGEFGVGQTVQKNGDDVLITTHRSVGRRDLGPGNTQAIAREMADALAGNFEEPVMTPTRSSFLAKWKPMKGATGYRLDVSTSPSFESYVSGYHDLDIGNTTSQVVSGLNPGTEYYYRLRTYSSSGASNNLEVTRAATASTSSGLVIIPT